MLEMAIFESQIKLHVCHESRSRSKWGKEGEPMGQGMGLLKGSRGLNKNNITINMFENVNQKK